MPSSDKKCPRCGLWNAGGALKCDCGYDFDAKQVAPAIQQRSELETKIKLEMRINAGANAFFWIAGLSLINSVSTLLGGSWQFLIGLGLTQFVDGFLSEAARQLNSSAATTIKLVAFVINVGAAALFAVFGILARKQHKWAFVVGMVLYALDGLVLLWARSYIGLAFHALVILWLASGLRAMSLAAALERGVDPLAVQEQMKPNRPPGRAFRMLFWVLIGLTAMSLVVFLIMLALMQ